MEHNGPRSLKYFSQNSGYFALDNFIIRQLGVEEVEEVKDGSATRALENLYVSF